MSERALALRAVCDRIDAEVRVDLDAAEADRHGWHLGTVVVEDCPVAAHEHPFEVVARGAA